MGKEYLLHKLRKGDWTGSWTQPPHKHKTKPKTNWPQTPKRGETQDTPGTYTGETRKPSPKEKRKKKTSNNRTAINYRHRHGKVLEPTIRTILCRSRYGLPWEPPTRQRTPSWRTGQDAGRQSAAILPRNSPVHHAGDNNAGADPHRK